MYDLLDKAEQEIFLKKFLKLFPLHTYELLKQDPAAAVYRLISLLRKKRKESVAVLLSKTAALLPEKGSAA